MNVYDSYNYTIHGVYKPTNITFGGATTCTFTSSELIGFGVKNMTLQWKSGDISSGWWYEIWGFLSHGGTPKSSTYRWDFPS